MRRCSLRWLTRCVPTPTSWPDCSPNSTPSPEPVPCLLVRRCPRVRPLVRWRGDGSRPRAGGSGSRRRAPRWLCCCRPSATGRQPSAASAPAVAASRLPVGSTMPRSTGWLQLRWPGRTGSGGRRDPPWRTRPASVRRRLLSRRHPRGRGRPTPRSPGSTRATSSRATAARSSSRPTPRSRSWPPTVPGPGGWRPSTPRPARRSRAPTATPSRAPWSTSNYRVRRSS